MFNRGSAPSRALHKATLKLKRIWRSVCKSNQDLGVEALGSWGQEDRTKSVQQSIPSLVPYHCPPAGADSVAWTSKANLPESSIRLHPSCLPDASSPSISYESHVNSAPHALFSLLYRALFDPDRMAQSADHANAICWGLGRRCCGVGFAGSG